MSYHYDPGSEMFGTSFSALEGSGMHPSFSPGPLGTSTNLGTQQTSDLARDELRNRDTQNASENLEKPLTRLMQDMINLEGDRAQRQDQQANTVLQGTQKVNERLDRIELTVETNGKQLSEILSLLKNGLRRSEQLPLPSTSQYAYGQGARPDSLSLPGHTQYAPAVRSEHLSYPGNMHGDKLLQEISSIVQRHKNGYTLRQ